MFPCFAWPRAAQRPGGSGSLDPSMAWSLRVIFAYELHRALQGASWTRQELSKISIHTPRSLLSTANNCCGFEIRSPSGNRGQDNYPHDRKSPSAFFPVINFAFSFLTVHLKRPVQHLKQQKVSALICSVCFAKFATNGSTRFVLNCFEKRD